MTIVFNLAEQRKAIKQFGYMPKPVNSTTLLVLGGPCRLLMRAKLLALSR